MFRRSCGCVHGKYYLIVCRSLRSTFQQPRTFSRIISYPFIIFRILRALSSHDNEWKVTLRSYVWVHPNPNIARVGTGSAKARIGSKSSTSKAQGRNRQWRRVAVMAKPGNIPVEAATKFPQDHISSVSLAAAVGFLRHTQHKHLDPLLHSLSRCMDG
jgi:hypothetical protein